MSEASRYKYYKIGDSNPVRVAYNDAGLKIGAERYDPEKDLMVPKATLLSVIERNPDSEEIDQTHFDKICEGLKKNTPVKQPN